MIWRPSGHTTETLGRFIVIVTGQMPVKMTDVPSRSSVSANAREV
jgi:hypothetical protein